MAFNAPLPYADKPDTAELAMVVEAIREMRTTIEGLISGGPATPNVVSMRLTGAGSYFTTPDSPAVSPTGDVDLSVHAALDEWTKGADQTLLAKWGPSYSYLFSVTASDKLQAAFFVPGAGSAYHIVQSTSAIAFADEALKWVRATRVASTGLVKLYSSDDGTTWTEIPSTDPTPGNAGALGDSAAPLTVGVASDGTNQARGRFLRAQVLNGIGGTVVADFDPALVARTAARTPTSFEADSGETWTAVGTGWDWLTA